MIVRALLGLASLLAALAAVQAQEPEQKLDWGAFYDAQERAESAALAAPGIVENWREVIQPALDPGERRRLAGVRFEVPVEFVAGVHGHPFNFYATADDRVIMPAGSIRMLRDLISAWLWLDAKGYSTNTVSEYLAVLKYRWTGGTFRGLAYRPFQVLGVPADAPNQPLIADKFARVFSNALFFVMAHELGHLVHGDRGIGVPGSAADSADSIRQETEADRFALEIMRRLGEVPDGAALFFTLCAPLQDFPSDFAAGTAPPLRSHPLSAERVLALAQGFDDNARGFARGLEGADAEASVRRVAAQLRDGVVPALVSPTIQDFWRQKGMSATLAELKPRPRDPAAGTSPKRDAGGAGFSGNFAGQWIDAKGSGIDVEMTLEPRGAGIEGRYRFGENEVWISNGVVENGRLNYGWKWGTDYFGHGVLEFSDRGQSLTGTWGYTGKDQGGGTWKLRRR